MFIALPVGGAGALIGHKLTGAKITIPLKGKSPGEKSRTLKEYLQVMSQKTKQKK